MCWAPPSSATTRSSRGQPLVDKILRRGDTAEAHLMLGTAHQMAQDFASAREEFAKAVALNPELPAAHAYYGRALMATGDPEASGRSVSQASSRRTPTTSRPICSWE